MNKLLPVSEILLRHRRLNKFMYDPAEALYKVSSNAKSVTFTDKTLVEIEVEVTKIPTQSFRLRPYADLAAIADQNRDPLGDLLSQ
ncbi:unnamed protein product [Cochlearia groenlandica]